MMNIKEAKNEIIHTLAAYLKKDENGNYTYPLVRQRPILLIGPPGIGKTAVMEQIAQECKVGLVAYTITHHTRQSAVGLPKIVSRDYDGIQVDITEYTMSEIIASVYDCMERTGKKEGILFIDEINCVSETLAPAMLQFLQNKTFGTHKVPKGWIIVAAGNPPAYNKSVREFDIVTLDRVRKISIQAEPDVWLEYARKRSIHGAILSYLSMKKENFYVVENTVDGKFFVTARGWEDLSEILKSYEELQVEISEELVEEFLQKEEIARDFASYYQLYEKYKTDYHLPEILEETASRKQYELSCNMAKAASFEERFTVTELLLEVVENQITVFEKWDKKTETLHENLRQLKAFLQGKDSIDGMGEFIFSRRKALKAKLDSELLTFGEGMLEEEQIRILEGYFQTLKEWHIRDTIDGYDRICVMFAKVCAERRELLEKTKKMLENAFIFMETCFGKGQELLLFETELTADDQAGTFISSYGCTHYFQNCDLLLYQKQEKELQKECRAILEDEN
ncbi:AAA family ATPase [Blautia sp. Sow4_E7]|uniref:ATP-binding protein n=1 Tax=Blautia sp. Sow4_E7 TaxID=3438749 RepID=UPI003F91A469